MGMISARNIRAPPLDVSTKIQKSFVQINSYEYRVPKVLEVLKVPRVIDDILMIID